MTISGELTNPPEESTEILAVLREELKLAWRVVLCAIYVLLWRARHYLLKEPAITKATAFVALVATLVLGVEIVLFFYHVELARWLGTTAISVLVPCTILLILHRVSEIKTERDEHIFTKQFSTLADAREAIAEAAATEKKVALDQLVAKVLEMICSDFARRCPANLSAMFPAKDGRLRIVYLYPVGTKYDPDFSLEIGEGCAGYCFKTKNIVYIPSIRYMHGIIVAVPAYGAREEYEIYNSILSVPIVSRSGIHGVLNIDSKYADAFDNHDFHLLKAYGRAIGEGISLAVTK
jgi:GAF domain